MPNLWVETEEQGWAVLALEHDRYAIDRVRAVEATPLRIRPAAVDELVAPPSFELRRVHGGREATAWAVLGDGDFSVNGIPTTTALRLLHDKDELCFGSCLRAFYSAESAAKVEPFPDAEDVICPRCRLPIHKNQPAVRCPSPDCGVWHHQITDSDSPQPCWTFAETCAACTQPSDLSAGLRWTPLGL